MNLPSTDLKQPNPFQLKSLKVHIIGSEEQKKNYRLCAAQKFHLIVQKVMGIGQFLNWLEFDFSLVGILADISRALSDAEISIVALSTFDTDYIMVKTIKVEQAKKVLSI